MEQLALQEERFEELKGTLHVISLWMLPPLYMFFWVADIIFFPELMWEFLLIRLLIVPICLFVQVSLFFIKNFRQGEYISVAFAFLVGGNINMLIYTIGDYSTPYYAGLNLVALGSLSFIPWSYLFFAFAIGVIYIPYYVGVLHKGDQNLPAIAVNSFFIIGTIVIGYVIKIFQEKLRISEFKARMALNDEIGNRDAIIIKQTEETLRLERLSSQFSPQVVRAIKDKKIDIDKIKQEEICCIFIDIVNSTERVAYLSEDKVHNSISKFLDDTIRILLKYNITIDKFLGDGILGFSNAPLKSIDSTQRAIDASLEIRDHILANKMYFENNWNSPMELRIGIASGRANVGFYGSGRFFKSYTALGAVVNMASRLCSKAEANEILVSEDVSMAVNHDEYEFSEPRPMNLKGFNKSSVPVRSLIFKTSSIHHSGTDIDCPDCHSGFMQLDLNDKGIYDMVCSSCGYTQSSEIAKTAA